MTPISNLTINDVKVMVSSIGNNTTLQPFESTILTFCAELSHIITTDNRNRSYPDLIAFGFWLRPTHLKKMQDEFLTPMILKVPRGLAFHITPGNVDTIFAYSWIISLLSGNTNIIRLSTKGGKSQKKLLVIIRELLEKSNYQQIRQNNLFINYKYDDEITAYLSSICDVRVIWGGDDTIKKIRRFIISATTKEIVFSDRFSFALIDAVSIIELEKNNPEQFKKLVSDFYKDISIYQQQACSSPKLLVWLGNEEDINNAGEVFWSQFKRMLEKNIEEVEASSIVEKMIFSQFYAAQGYDIILDCAPEIHRVQLNSFKAEYQKKNCGDGYLFEINCSRIEELNEITNKTFQTCSYFGFDIEKLKNTGVRNILRFTPIGRAIEFEHHWDGMDLLSEFSININFY